MFTIQGGTDESDPYVHEATEHAIELIWMRLCSCKQRALPRPQAGERVRDARPGPAAGPMRGRPPPLLLLLLMARRARSGDHRDLSGDCLCTDTCMVGGYESWNDGWCDE